MAQQVYLEQTAIWSSCLGSGDITTWRCTGRKVAPASLVVRGSVQIVAAIATQIRSFTAQDLATVSIEAWRSVRTNLSHY